MEIYIIVYMDQPTGENAALQVKIDTNMSHHMLNICKNFEITTLKIENNIRKVIEIMKSVKMKT